MVLRHPETVVAERVYMASERDGVLEGLGRRRAGGDRGLIQYGETKDGHRSWMIQVQVEEQVLDFGWE